MMRVVPAPGLGFDLHTAANQGETLPHAEQTEVASDRAVHSFLLEPFAVVFDRS